MTTWAELVTTPYPTPPPHGLAGNTNAKREGPSRTDLTPRRFKTCFGCHVTLPRAEFYKHPTAPYGIGPRCKACVKELRRESDRWREFRPGSLDTYDLYGVRL